MVLSYRGSRCGSRAQKILSLKMVFRRFVTPCADWMVAIISMSVSISEKLISYPALPCTANKLSEKCALSSPVSLEERVQNVGGAIEFNNLLNEIIV